MKMDNSQKKNQILAIPPGVTIKEQLLERGIKQKEFAVRMGMSEKHISKLINGEVQLTVETARKLEMVLGIPTQFWCNLEMIYREKLVKFKEEKEIEDLENRSDKVMMEIEIAERMPYQEMVKKGWIVETSEISKKVVHLRKYFEVAELKFLQQTLLPRIACRKLSEKEKIDCELIAWVQKAKKIAREQEVNQIHIEKLENEIPHIREIIHKNSDTLKEELKIAFADCGISLVFLPRINESLPHGAAFLDGNKVIILLNEDMNDQREFQLSLFHEIAHIIYGHLDKEEGTSEEDEKLADEFAQKYLE